MEPDLELAGFVLTLRRAALDLALAPRLGFAALALPVLAPLALELPLARVRLFSRRCSSSVRCVSALGAASRACPS